MKIELEEPFKSKWKTGYLRKNRQNRRVVDLYNTAKDRDTIAYAKYLMCVKLGYIIEDGIEVDHIDNDKTNDDIKNLQLLTSDENKRKVKGTKRKKLKMESW